MDEKTLYLERQTLARESVESTIRNALVVADICIQQNRDIVAEALQDDHLARLVTGEADSLNGERPSVPGLYGFAEGKVCEWMNKRTEEYLSTQDGLNLEDRRKYREQIRSSARLVTALLVSNTAELLNSGDWDDPYNQVLMFILGWHMSELDKRFPQGIMHHEVIKQIHHSAISSRARQKAIDDEKPHREKLLNEFREVVHAEFRSKVIRNTVALLSRILNKLPILKAMTEHKRNEKGEVVVRARIGKRCLLDIINKEIKPNYRNSSK